jgi:hypothetical protein
MKAQFITSNYIYKYTVIESNVEAELVTKFILKAQDLNIQSTLGSHLYNKLVNDCPNFTGAYLTLVKDFIQPAQAEWTVYHALPFINFHLTNKSVATRTSDSSQPSTIEDLRWLQSQVRNNAEFYSERLRDEIKNNPSLYPEFYTSEPGKPFDVKPNKTNYFSGIHTSGSGYFRAKVPPLNQIDPNDLGGCC